MRAKISLVYLSRFSTSARLAIADPPWRVKWWRQRGADFSTYVTTGLVDERTSSLWSLKTTCTVWLLSRNSMQ